MATNEWSENLKKLVIQVSVDRILGGFYEAGMPPDVMCSIGMSITGSVIASAPDDSEFRKNSVLSLEKMSFSLRHMKKDDKNTKDGWMI